MFLCYKQSSDKTQTLSFEKWRIMDAKHITTYQMFLQPFIV